MPSEKIEVTSQEMSFDEFMQGVEHQDGGRHDLNPRGMSSVPQESGVDTNHTVDLGPSVYVPEQQFNPQTHQMPEQQVPLEQDWKRLYGQSENEKGELRREVNTLREEVAAMRSAWNPQAQYQPAYATPTYTYPQPQWQAQQTQTAPQVPVTFFEGKEDGEVVEVGEVNRLMRETVAPAVWQLYTQQLEMQKQQIAMQKLAAGISLAVEQKLLTSRPWLANVPDGFPRIQAMQEILKQEANQQGVPTPQPPTNIPPHQAAVRRVTYVEPGTGQTSAPVMDPNERFKQEWAKTRTAAEKRALLERYGIGRANDFGPEYYTR